MPVSLKAKLIVINNAAGCGATGPAGITVQGGVGNSITSGEEGSACGYLACPTGSDAGWPWVGDGQLEQCAELLCRCLVLLLGGPARLREATGYKERI